MISDQDYRALAEFRFALRRFTAFSKEQAVQAGLSPQQHQALLAIRGSGRPEVTVGDIAERLTLQPHSASELVNRMEMAGLIARRHSATDRRCVTVAITDRGTRLLEELSAAHRRELLEMRPMLIELLASLD